MHTLKQPPPTKDELFLKLGPEMRMIENEHGVYIRDQIASIFPDRKIYFMTDYYDTSRGFCRDPSVFIDYKKAFTDAKFFEITWMRQDHLQEVIDKKAFLVYEMFLESGESYVKWMYMKCLKRGIPPEQIIIVGPSLDFQSHSEKFAKIFNVKPMTNVYYTFFERNTKRRFLLDNLGDAIDKNSSLKTLESLIPIEDVKTTDPLGINQFRKRFIFLNHSARMHRIFLLSLLNHANLLDHGYVSFLTHHLKWKNSMLESEIRKIFSDKNKYDQVVSGLDILEKVPLYVDDIDSIVQLKQLKGSGKWMSGAGVGNPANISLNALYDFINHSFLNVVSETFFNSSEYAYSWNGNKENRFLTEKTFKAIAFKQPFILVAYPKTLEMLKSLGYKTFHPIIDESYDSIVDDGERLYKVFLEIKRVCEVDEKTLEEYRKQLIPIVEHNYNLLMNRKNYFHLLKPTSNSAI
jgi:hypothetical protein